MNVPDDDRFLAARHEAKAQVWMPGQSDVARMRRLLTPVLPRIFIGSGLVKVTEWAESQTNRLSK